MTTVGTAPVTVAHLPHGIEHPYATSLDQRVPVMPEVETSALLGVQVTGAVDAVTCEWEPPSGGVARLDLAPRSADAADTAALAGGEGHLAAAQAASIGGDGGWAVTTPVLTDRRGHRYRFTAHGADGTEASTDWFDLHPVWWTDTPPDGFRVDLDVEGQLVDGSVEWLVSEVGIHAARLALALAEGDHVAGFGERYDHLDQAGHTLDAVVFEQYKSQGAHGRTYLPMPFAHVVSRDGSTWGFHVRTSRRTWFDVGAGAADRLVITVSLGGTPTEQVSVGVFDGSPTEVLSAFLDEAGRAERLPAWVFRLWASGNEWNTQQLVLDRMRTHRELDIPVGAVVIEAWSDEEGIMIPRDAQYAPNPDAAPFADADFTHPPDGAWPDPRGMVAELHDHDVKVLLWQIPLLKTDASEPGLGDQVRAEGVAMVEGGHAVTERDGTAYLNRGWWFAKSLMPDLSTEAGRQWWTSKRDYLVRDWDIDGFKTDGGEHAWGHDLVHADGRRGDEGNNLYPVNYARAFGDLLRRHGKAPITFSRSGFTGSQAHGIFWAGDEDSTWEAFAHSVTAGLTAGACGIVYWGWDLAGFSGPVPDAELYLRAAGASAFMPIMQYHSEFNHHQEPLRDRTPWHVATMTGDSRVVPVFREFARLRERLVRHLDDEAAITVATDRPLMRALFFDHPGDAQVWDHPHQWLLGGQLLVNPVLRPGATTWDTYLPEGDWVEVWSGARHRGGRVVTTPVPIDVVPVFCRAESWSRMAPIFASGRE